MDLVIAVCDGPFFAETCSQLIEFRLRTEGRREDMVVLSSGQRLQSETTFSYALKRGPRGWVIDQVRESASQPAQTRPAQPRVPRRSDATP